jgi:hypothetical protein
MPGLAVADTVKAGSNRGEGRRTFPIETDVREENGAATVSAATTAAACSRPTQRPEADAY